MDHVLEAANGVKTYRFDSGPNMAEPWIGFNVNDMAYFFAIPLDRPETLYLERYSRLVDPSSCDRSFGDLETETPGGVTRWYAELDLLDPGLGFGNADEIEQEGKLAAFFERAFAFGERLPTVSQTTA